MANISAIKLPSGNTYDLVDKTSGYVTTDEKLVVNQENSNNTYYPIISTSSTAASTKYIDTRGIKLDITNGTERSQGDITLVLGNSTAVNYDGNKAGLLQLYGPYSRYVQIQTPSSFTSDVYLTLPSSTGTLALISNIKDATLTIQKNGVNVETFSANASSNKTANIVVNEVPSGGTTGQVLAKNSATDYDVEWADASGGAFIVTFTYDNEEDEWSCDKTAQQIYEAYQANKSITAVSTYPDDVGIIFYLDTIRHYYVEEEEHIYIRFIPQQHTDGGSNATIHNLTLELYQDGWVERTYNEVEAVTNTYGISSSSYIITDDGERGGQIRATNDNSGASATIYWSAMDGMSYDESVITFSAEHIKTDQVSPTEDYDVATKEYVDSSVSGISVPTKTSDLTNDSGFISTETDPTVPSWAKQSTKPTYTASEVGALPDTTTIPSKTSDLNNDSGFITGMTILSYGSSTWQNFIDAYNANKVVYCRASSNSNPGSGSQTRLAFMAYVNNATTPTEVEFQYYRSVSTHTASQQGDQVYVYKLNKTNGWSVTVREASVKVVAGTGLSGTYSNGTMTLTAPHDTTKQDTLVSGTNIKTINNESLLGSGNITVSAEAGIFVCEYGVTSFADALVAYNAGKRLVCHYNDGANDFFVWLVICDSESTYFWFEVTSGDKRMEFCLDQNGWTRSEYPASAIPIARRISKFNSDSRMNSTDMTSQEVEDFVDDLDVTGGLLGDYVVEQGTSGIWTYRKWNSGIAECWSYMTGTTDSSGRWHYNPSLPTFFTSTQIIVNATGWSNGYISTYAGYTRAGYASNQWSIDGYLTSGAQSNSCGVSLSVIGKWK